MTRSRRTLRAGLLALLAAGILAGCAGGGRDVIYLNLMWHQHQPQYYADAETGVITRPWVRMHSQKSYYDMAALVAEYPDVKVTFNLTPVLLRQIDQFLGGAKDRYWVLAEVPADELTTDEKRFILERFFDANRDNIVGRFPRYRELLAKRGDGGDLDAALERYTTQDFRDLQVWFNLAWFDPSFLAEEPLATLVEQGRDFTEAQKSIVFDESLRIMGEIVAIHRELQNDGRIEITTTPYAHPILPLIYDSDLVEENDPAAEVPARFSYPNDAIAHLDLAVEQYTQKFGRAPRGIWPAEGSVAQEIVRIVANAGITWMASGEQVLAKSLGIGAFTRDEDDTVREADALYRPYYAVNKDDRRVAVVFRDLRISDLIGFEYSGTPASEAVADFIGRIERIKARLDEEGAEGPHLVSVILDGENAWEHYPNDGIAFLRGLYEALSEHPTIRTITPGDYLERYPEQRTLDDLWPGSWFSPDFSTWIGEPEETLAWEYLERTRRHLARYDIQRRAETTPERLDAALEAMYLAEGSDWFWWYGSDQDSGVDEYFDEGYRALLREVYVALGGEVPSFVSVPIIPERPAQPERAPRGAINPRIDGREGADEWSAAGYYEVRGATMARASDQIASLHYGFNADGFAFLIEGRSAWSQFADHALTVYVSLPGQETASAVTAEGSVLGFRAGYSLRIEPATGRATIRTVDRFGEWVDGPSLETVAVAGRTIEAFVDVARLTDVQPGDVMDVKAVLADAGGSTALVPASGPARVVIPDLGTAISILDVDDPSGDDHGPGAYTYPTDAVFAPGAFDIERFTVAYNERNLVCTFRMGAAIGNPWGSAIGLSVQTFDIYVDVDGDSTGTRALLEGRNATLEPGHAWDFAIWAEGWNQKLLVPNDAGNPVELPGNPVRVVVDADNATVSILVPRDIISDAIGASAEANDPETWSYLAVVLSQDGFPSAGVRRVRDVEPVATQWRIGGGSDPATDTRILDAALPNRDSLTGQEAALAGEGLPMVGHGG